MRVGDGRERVVAGTGVVAGRFAVARPREVRSGLWLVLGGASGADSIVATNIVLTGGIAEGAGVASSAAHPDDIVAAPTSPRIVRAPIAAGDMRLHGALRSR